MVSSLTFPDIPGNAGADVAGKQLFVERIHCSIDCSGLNQDIITVGIILHHSYNASDLAFNTFQTVDQLFSPPLNVQCVFSQQQGQAFFFQT